MENQKDKNENENEIIKPKDKYVMHSKNTSKIYQLKHKKRKLNLRNYIKSKTCKNHSKKLSEEYDRYIEGKKEL